MSYYINQNQQIGTGLLIREPGKLEPSGRQLLSEIGNEEIKTIDIVRTPLTAFTKTFLSIISLGQFDKISKKYYDEMFHLSLWINGKYNLEKNAVVKFNRENPKKSNSEVKSVSVIPAGITIQQLIDNAIKRMGPENFSNYDAERLNCQNFVLNVLDGSGIGDKGDGDFIFQDASQIFKELPEFSKVLGKASVKLGAIFNRLIYGEGQQQGDGLINDFLTSDVGKIITSDIRKAHKNIYGYGEGQQQGGASYAQIGQAAALRDWVPNINDPLTNRYYRYTLNEIVHSGDRSNRSIFHDITNTYDSRINAINWPLLTREAMHEKGAVFYPGLGFTYPTRTPGMS